MPFDLNKIRREGDAVMEGGRETDIVILVMGPTGAGKSTFLQNVLTTLKYEGELPGVSDGFEACTRNVAAYIAPLPLQFATVDRQRLVLVDTPGFDDCSGLSFNEVLRRIAVWLASSYISRMKVGGVVYMFPIYPNRLTRTDLARLKVFRRMCGEDALRMVTTKWSLGPDKRFVESREEQLRTCFWKDMIDGGAGLSRLDNDHASAAGELLADLLTKSRQVDQKLRQLVDIPLAIQREIVDQFRPFAGTNAGQELTN
ncbi:P-loop containing nucleoside triphosphate hydrolase protein [Coprinopsis sp. MPI-PUGE-AT-0042]|nr:P-loop containing nucleoside triphosphate hydrolase protein [Coprinopsis sp. MPI-PUGE-AT-0042]